MKTILEEFNYVVTRYGTNVALKEGLKSLTYTELDEESSKIASYLKSKGLQKGECVSIYIKRSMETVVSILGILKAGGAYVPLDPSNPVARNKYIIEDTKSMHVITDKNHIRNIKELVPTDTSILLLEDIKILPKVEEKFVDAHIDDLAYVIHTSGTTGNPKGALLRHRGVSNIMGYLRKDWGIAPEDKLLQFASYSFDGSVMDTFNALYNGATLYLIDDDERMSESAFLEVVERENITIISAIPTVFFNRIVNYINENGLTSFDKVEKVAVAGEILTGDLARKFKSSIGEKIRFFNLYGPTEATVFVSAYEVPSDLSEDVYSVPIGKDLPGTELYVVTEDGKLCEPNEVGELWIATEGIALGYLNNPTKTAESFVPNPFNDTIYGGRVYKSGDLVKRLDDGNIEFVSRKDTQVKIRGHRIEIAEIETHMNAIDGVKDAVVVVEVVNGEKELKGFFTSDNEVSHTEIITNLKQILSSYMIPTMLKQIDDIPFGTTGKADRKALEQMKADVVVLHTGEKVEARNGVEKTILTAWQEVLGNTNISVTDNLFDVGGHSLKIIAILSKLKSEFPTLSIKDFFELKTVEKLAIKAMQDSNKGVSEFKQGYVELAEYPKMLVDTEFGNVDHVLVTGATGFLGSHIVNKLLKEDRKVIALVRGEDAVERMQDTLKNYFSIESHPNLYIIKGDLTEKNFGMEKDKFNYLASGLDAVIHAAADVRHFGNREHFEKINVEGTKNVFDLVESNPAIVFHHISTVGVLDDLLREGKWGQLEGTTEMPDGLSVDSVYTDTKMMAEKFILDKVKEGKEVFVYRMGNLIGRYTDGMFQKNIDANAFYRMLKLMILGKKAPTVQWKVDFMPIDFASEVVVKSVLAHDKQQRVYHVAHPEPINFSEVIEVLNSLGHTIYLEEQDDYNTYIVSDVVGVEVQNLAVAQLDGDGANNSNAIYSSTNTMQVLGMDNIPVLGEEYIGKLIKHAIEVGFIKVAVTV